MCLDEGHVMRNPKTAIWKTAYELKAASRLILSGTPVQNRFQLVILLFVSLFRVFKRRVSALPIYGLCLRG